MFMNLVAGNGATRVNTGKDIIPPQSPIISALPEATNSAGIAIDGFTEKNALVDLLVNDLVEKTGTADEKGAFIFEGNLVLGLNRIQLRAKDAAGNESMSEVILITYDNKPLVLTITSPKDGSEYFGKINQVVDIKGEISKPSGQVLINNSFVTVDRMGQFVHRLMLSGGDNNIKIVGSDKAGNVAEQNLKLVYTP
jgi:bacillopeptidase F